MSATVRAVYKGWEIFGKCLEHKNSDPRLPKKFTGRAFAKLNHAAQACYWTDPSLQTSAIVSRTFGSAEACSEALVAQIGAVIDALHRSAPDDGRGFCCDSDTSSSDHDNPGSSE